jgi:hypothetical protein
LEPPFFFFFFCAIFLRNFSAAQFLRDIFERARQRIGAIFSALFFRCYFFGAIFFGAIFSALSFQHIFPAFLRRNFRETGSIDIAILPLPLPLPLRQ